MIEDPLAEADWSLIPDHLRGSLKRYIYEGRIPGDFLIGCLANDLEMALDFAYPGGLDTVVHILDFLKKYAPKTSFGRAESLARWEAIGGWQGLAELSEYGGFVQERPL